MAIKLPRPINDYINASNAHDVKSILACFSDDAVVHDEEERFMEKRASRGGL
jgi:ketosteroid isomerase-like protein